MHHTASKLLLRKSIKDHNLQGISFSKLTITDTVLIFFTKQVNTDMFLSAKKIVKEIVQFAPSATFHYVVVVVKRVANFS